MIPMIARRRYRPFIVPSLFDDELFRGTSNGAGTTTQSPAVNIREDEKSYTLELAVPGIDKKDLKIEINDDTLTISLERSEEQKVEENGYRRREFNYSAFSKSFYLPEDVNRDKIDALYKDGVLTVDLKKAEEQAKLSRVVKIS